MELQGAGIRRGCVHGGSRAAGGVSEGKIRLRQPLTGQGARAHDAGLQGLYPAPIVPTMHASPAACLRSPVEIGALPIMRSCSPGNPDIRLGQATACLPRLRPCPQRSRRDSASGSSRRRKQLSTGKTQPDAKLGERESRNRNRNRQRKILMLIFSSTERPSQGLGGQLGDPGARAIQAV